MENKIFARNRDALCRHNINLFENENIDNNEAIMEFAKNGDKIVAYKDSGKNIYLNSKYNPTDEANRFMEAYFSVPDKAVVTMFGMANGSFLRAILENNPKDFKCVVFEPSVSIFMQVMQNIDITDILNDERVCIVVNDINTDLFEKILTDLIQSYNRRTSVHIVLPKYEEIFSDAYIFFRGVIEDQYRRLKVETLTTSTCGKQVCENNIYNMYYLKGARNAEDFAGTFPEKMPAIVVGAGPSLEKNIDLLKLAKGKALIAVTDSAIKHVMARGITPDVIFSIDFDKPIELFEGKDVDRLPFVVDLDVNHKVLDMLMPKQLIVYTSDTATWGRLFESGNYKISDISSGGSVSTATISNLISWGFKNIIMIGQDLALTGNKGHIGEQSIELDRNNKKYVELEAIGGGTVLTRSDLYQYIKHIENISVNFPDVKIIDATEGGAKKKNTVIMSFKEALDEFCKNEYDISGIWQRVPQMFFGEKEGLIAEAFCTMKNNLKNLKRLTISAVTDSGRAATLLERKDFNKKELKKITDSMGKLDEKLLAMDEYAFVIKHISEAEEAFADDMYIEEADDIAEAIRLYRKTEKYYGAIADAIPDIINMIEECEKRLADEKRG